MQKQPDQSHSDEFDRLDYFFALFEDTILRNGALGSRPSDYRTPRNRGIGRTDMAVIEGTTEVSMSIAIIAVAAIGIGAWGGLYLLLRLLAPLIRRYRRSQYYPLENEKRRYLRERAKRKALAKAKKDIKAYGIGHGQHIRIRRTLNPIPTPKELLAQWDLTRENRIPIEKVRLGAMLAAVESTVDNALRRDEEGNIIGRNPGLRGWLNLHCPQLAPHYKTLMRYKAVADKMQEVYGLEDPYPTTLLLPPPQREPHEETPENGAEDRVKKDPEKHTEIIEYKGVYEIENSGGTYHIDDLVLTDEWGRRISERRTESLDMLQSPCGSTMRNLEDALLQALCVPHLPRKRMKASPHTRPRLHRISRFHRWTYHVPAHSISFTHS